VLEQPGNEAVTTVNPVVGETNDGRLNDIRRRVLTPATIRRAIDAATDGPVTEGSVGAGTGTLAFGWKGGIGTSSRKLPGSVGGYTVGALVQSNFGGILQVAGIPVGRRLGRVSLADPIDGDAADGSIMIVLATDAPLSDRNLTRLARRGLFGLARTGASFANGSGDYAIAFSTSEALRGGVGRHTREAHGAELPNDALSPLFQAVLEATEEAILNSLFTATTVTGFRGRVGEAIPLDRIAEMVRRRS
jgi:D-aminopeptidase